MDPLWSPYGPPLDPLIDHVVKPVWAPYGPPVDPLWTPYGPSTNPMASYGPLWTFYEPPSNFTRYQRILAASLRSSQRLKSYENFESTLHTASP